MNIRLLHGSAAYLSASKWWDYLQLCKVRLSLTVVFSAMAGFALGMEGDISWSRLFLLLAGGLAITCAANAMNQALEAEEDKLMRRTAARPVPAGRMQVREAFFFASSLGVAGMAVLSCISPSCGLLGLLAVLLYAFGYTALKKISSFCVACGAVAGALPVVIGWLASGNTHIFPVVSLFTLLFLWQFPHTWAVAWLNAEDYHNAGFRLQPAKNMGKVAFLITLYSAALIPIGFVLHKAGIAGPLSAYLCSLSAVAVTVQSIRLCLSRGRKDAVKVMRTVLIYLPFVLSSLMIEKWIENS